MSALHSTITCPSCGHRETELMPADGYQVFYYCKGCGELLRPPPGECCVFCSFGSVMCPSKTKMWQDIADRFGAKPGDQPTPPRSGSKKPKRPRR